MKVLVLLILAVICVGVDGLSCINQKEPLKQIWLGFTLDSLVKRISNLTSINVGQNDLCRAEIRIEINSIWTFMTISFTNHLEDSMLDDNIIEYYTYLGSTETGDIDIRTFLQYACSEDNCDKKFIIDHIGWLLEQTHSQLSLNISQYFKDDKQELGMNSE